MSLNERIQYYIIETINLSVRSIINIIIRH